MEIGSFIDQNRERSSTVIVNEHMSTGNDDSESSDVSSNRTVKGEGIRTGIGRYRHRYQHRYRQVDEK